MSTTSEHLRGRATECLDALESFLGTNEFAEVVRNKAGLPSDENSASLVRREIMVYGAFWMAWHAHQFMVRRHFLVFAEFDHRGWGLFRKFVSEGLKERGGDEALSGFQWYMGQLQTHVSTRNLRDMSLAAPSQFCRRFRQATHSGLEDPYRDGIPRRISQVAADIVREVLGGRGSTTEPSLDVPERCKALVCQLWDESPIVVTRSESEQTNEVMGELAEMAKTNPAVVPYLASVLENRKPDRELPGCRQERLIMVVLALSGDSKALPVLERQLLRSDDNTTRIRGIWKAAAFALRQTHSPDAVAVLRKGAEMDHATAECLEYIEELSPSAAAAETSPEPRFTSTVAMQEYDRLANVKASDLAIALSALTCETEENARRFLLTVVGPKIKNGDLDATLASLVQCLLSHRMGTSLLRINVMKRDDGPMPRVSWIGIYPDPEQWNHAVVRTAQDRWMLATH